jgi:hypothetical protein
MIEQISLIALSCIVAIELVLVIFYKIKYDKMIRVIAQLIIDKEVLADKLDRTILENSKEVNEGFIKFLSDSRQAAFDYIEDVQKAVQNYLVATQNNNSDAIVTARMELFSYLPEDPESQDKNQG